MRQPASDSAIADDARDREGLEVGVRGLAVVAERVAGRGETVQRLRLDEPVGRRLRERERPHELLDRLGVPRGANLERAEGVPGVPLAREVAETDVDRDRLLERRAPCRGICEPAEALADGAERVRASGRVAGLGSSGGVLAGSLESRAHLGRDASPRLIVRLVDAFANGVSRRLLAQRHLARTRLHVSLIGSRGGTREGRSKIRVRGTAYPLLVRVLGIDPGTASCGYGVVDGDGGRIHCLAFGKWTSSPREPIELRLRRIFEGVQEAIVTSSPDVVAVEESVVGADARIALSIGQARGAVLVAAATRGLPCIEISPTRVKQTICGYGRADKGQVQRMVRIILSLDREPPGHEADALAVAICHAMSSPLAALA